MKRSSGTKWSNLKVGALLMVAAALMFWASFTGSGTSIFEPKKSFTCYFKNINGLLRGSPVWMSGVEVGNVRSVSFVNLDSLRQVEVGCRVKASVWHMMTEGTEVTLGTIGFLGDKFVEVFPGPNNNVEIAEGVVVPTRIVADASAVFDAGEDAFRQMESLVGNLDTVMARMRKGEGTLGQLSSNDQLYIELTALLANLTNLSGDLQTNQERITNSIEKTANSVEDLSQQVSNNTGTLGKLMNDPALYDNLATTSARLDTVMTRISNAEGSMGLLVSDTALYVEVVDLLARVNNLVANIEKNPRKYFKFSVF